MGKQTIKEKVENFQSKTTATLETVEISASLSAKIPIANYESYQPFYSIKEIYSTKDGAIDTKERVEQIRKFLSDQLKKDYEKVEVERIENTKQNIRFYERGDQKYPSVTSIINPEGIDYDPVKLEQYAARGTIVHKQCEIALESGILESMFLADKKLLPSLEAEYAKLIDPHSIKDLEPEVLIVEQGDLQLSWEECNFRAFYEKYHDDFKYEKLEQRVYDDEYRYAGTLDVLGLYKGEPAIIDFKTSGSYDKAKVEKYMMQLAAYAHTQPGITTLVIIPLNPGNKSGYGSPIVTKNIDKYFHKFLEARRLFKRLYGV